MSLICTGLINTRTGFTMNCTDLAVPAYWWSARPDWWCDKGPSIATSSSIWPARVARPIKPTETKCASLTQPDCVAHPIQSKAIKCSSFTRPTSLTQRTNSTCKVAISTQSYCSYLTYTSVNVSKSVDLFHS
jgi:hypothetical protein